MTENEAYLRIIEGWLRDNRDLVHPTGSVEDLCRRIVVHMEAKDTKIERLRTAVGNYLTSGDDPDAIQALQRAYEQT